MQDLQVTQKLVSLGAIFCSENKVIINNHLRSLPYFLKNISGVTGFERLAKDTHFDRKCCNTSVMDFGK